MITLLIGENSFEVKRALDAIVSDFDGVVERIDGDKLQLSQLPDLLMGVSLFATARTVVIRQLSENKSIWASFGDWIGKISDDIHLVLIEPKPDKRTTTFKAIKDAATVKEFQPFTDRDVAAAEKWAASEAEKLGIKLDKKSVQFLVARVGVDQWQLYNALQKLALVDDVSVEKIQDVIDPNPAENVFNLFETAVSGDRRSLKASLTQLEQTEDVYRLSALLFSQVFQLAVMSSAEKTDNPSKDFGIHPFVSSKLGTLAKKLGSRNIAKIVDIFVRADDDMKTSSADPWLIIEQALMKVANI